MRFAILAYFLVLASAAEAHPHVWVAVKTTVLFKAGTIVGLRHKWTFDKYYTAMALEGLDANKDGIYSKGELAPLAQTNMDGMKRFDYFTVAKLAGRDLKFSAPVDYWLDYTNKILTLHFTLPFAHPVPAAAKGFSFAVYDQSFFIAFNLAKKDPFALGGEVPVGCKAAIRDNAAEAQRLSQAFAQQFGTASFGGNLGQSIAVACPSQ
jgi:ABC-type uncharacterized transport system substrate-binding protein